MFFRLLILFFQNANILPSPSPSASPTATPVPTPDGIQIVGITIPNVVTLIISIAAFLTACAVIYKYVWLPVKKAFEAIKTLDKVYSTVKQIADVFGANEKESLPNTINAINTTLAELQAMVELILANSPTATYLMDEKGRCTYVNEAWTAITGLTKEKAAGNGWTRAIHDDDKARVFEEWTDSRADDRPFACDFRFVHQQSGKIAFVRASSISVKNRQYVIVAYIGEIKVLRVDNGDTSFKQ